MATLGSICQFINGGTPSKEVSRYFEGEIPWITSADITGPIAGTARSFITPEAIENSATNKVAKGTVLLVTRTGVGKVAIAGCDLCFSQDITAIRPDAQRLDSGYLAHFLTTKQSHFDRYARGATIKGITRDVIANLEIPLPPLQKQRRIATILDKADALRTKRNKALAQLDRLAQSIFLEMFGDPVTNPMGWKTQRLDSICEVGSSKRVFVEELTKEGVPFFRGTEIGEFGEGIRAKPTLFISNEHYSRLKAEAGVPRKGDLLLPSICPDGRIFVVDTDEPFYFKDARVLWIKVQQHQISSLFLRHYLKLVFAKDYSKIASGTTFAELKIFALKQLVIASPPTKMQRRFESVVLSIEAQTKKSKQSHQELSNLFSSLQHRAFRGEL